MMSFRVQGSVVDWISNAPFLLYTYILTCLGYSPSIHFSPPLNTTTTTSPSSYLSLSTCFSLPLLLGLLTALLFMWGMGPSYRPIPSCNRDEFLHGHTVDEPGVICSLATGQETFQGLVQGVPLPYTVEACYSKSV